MNHHEIDELRGWVDCMVKASDDPGEMAIWEGVTNEAVNGIAAGETTWPDELRDMVFAYVEAMGELLDESPILAWGPGDSIAVVLAMMLIENGVDA